MKTAISTLKRNLIYSAVYQIFNILIPLITAPYVSRVLGVNNIGLYSVSFSTAHVFQSLAYLGLKNYGTRAIAQTRHSRDETSRKFCEIFCMQFVTGLLTVFAYLLYCIRLDGIKRDLALIGAFYVAVAFIDISWFYFGLENFRITVIRNMLIRFLSAAAVFLLVKTDADLLKYMVIVVGGSFLGQMALWLRLNQFVSFVRISLRDVLRHIRPNLILFIPVISVNVYKYMDKVMIGVLSDSFQAGLYESAERIVRVPGSILTAFSTVMLSRASGRDGNHDGRKDVTVSMILTMFAASLMCFGIIACASMFVPVYYGAGYADCIALMQYLSPSVLAVAWSNVIRTQCLIPNSHDRFYAVSISAGAVTNFCLNWLLIQKSGAMGAVLATLVTEMLIAVLQTAYCRMEFDLPECLRSSAPFVCIGAITCVAAGISKQMEPNSVRLILLVAAFFAVYGVLSFAYLYQRQRPILRMILPERRMRRKGHEKSSDYGNQSGDQD